MLILCWYCLFVTTEHTSIRLASVFIYCLQPAHSSQMCLSATTKLLLTSTCIFWWNAYVAIKNKGCYIYGSVYVSGNTIQFWKFIVLAPIPKQSYKCTKMWHVCALCHNGCSCSLNSKLFQIEVQVHYTASAAAVTYLCSVSYAPLLVGSLYCTAGRLFRACSHPRGDI